MSCRHGQAIDAGPCGHCADDERALQSDAGVRLTSDERLRAALRPFARFFAGLPKEKRDHLGLVVASEKGVSSLLVMHLRDAAMALEVDDG